jgi:2-desacetyl-2-hydroxyethyl bacteriochlorophyllide A dehydrogenase
VTAPATMRRVRFTGSESVSVEETPLPGIGPGDVLVRVGASAICGSEMGSYRSPEGAAPLANPGHEIVGTIVESPADESRVGQRVAINIITGCGHCVHCLRRDRRFCAEQGYVMNGHADYVVVPAYTCMPLPEDVPFDLGVLIGGDTLGVAFHALSRIPVRPLSRALVVGAGPVGSGFVALLAHLGIETTVVEISPYRQELARAYGASIVDPRKEDAVAAARELTGGEGPDIAIDATGRDEGVNIALDTVRKQGTMIFAGAGRTATINPWLHFLEKEITAHGVWYFVDDDFYGLLELYRQGLEVQPLLTHRFDLADAAEAYSLFAKAETGKVVFLDGSN